MPLTVGSAAVVVNPESSFYGRLGRVERIDGSTFYLRIRAASGRPATLPFGRSEVAHGGASVKTLGF